MAVFMVNICKFNSCGLTFPNLADLIQHIEDTHIDYDPRTVEQKELQQPSCLPLSYVLRFLTDAARKEGLDTKRKVSHSQGIKNSYVPRSSTPTGSEADEDEVMSESEDSNDSWTTPEEFSAEFILRYGSSRMLNSSIPNNNNNNNTNIEKPFACPVPGCKKRYKNVNGIKYHSKNGHKKDGKVRKGFKCHCGKSYKTAQGLKNHTSAHHSGVNLATLTTQTGEVLQIPTSRVAALQPLRAVTLKQISTASLNAIGLPIKTIQGIVVSTKQGDTTLKSDGTFETITFAKGSTIQMAVPTLVTPTSTKGLVNCIQSTKSTPEKTLTTTLGVLTPASSPQTPPSEAGATKMPTPMSLSLPLTSSTTSLNTVTKSVDFAAPIASMTTANVNQTSVVRNLATELSSSLSQTL